VSVPKICRDEKEEPANRKLGSTVLYVSNDFDEGKLLELILGSKRNDRVITCAPDLHSVQLVAGREHIGLVLLKFITGVDNLDGFLLYRQLRSVPALEEVPVLFWRVPNPKTVYREAQRLGVSGCIHFVFQPQDLLAARDAALMGDTYYPSF
jgi:CheY-like chemotaxis protein